MAKITAKHFLNTNLKPYLINKEKHFSVYIALVAYRKNTKVKSITFDEYYNENTFNEIFNSTDEYDINLIENEIKTLSLITEIAVNILNDFDTAFVTAFFKFSSIINIDSNLEFDKYKREFQINNISGRFYEIEKFANYFKVVETHEIEKLDFVDFEFDYSNNQEIRQIMKKIPVNITFDEYLINNFGTITIFDFFNKKNQNKLLNIIEKFFNDDNHSDFIFEYNKAIFLNSLNRFSNYIRNTKNDYLNEKYQKIFDSAYNNKF